MRRIAVVAIVSSLACASPAYADIQATLNPDGTGGMIANSTTNPAGETWSWESCDPTQHVCAPFATGRIANTGTAAPDTVFKATSSDAAVVTSPTWWGNVTLDAPPGVGGEVRANALVMPVPASWHGGWEGDEDGTQLAACEDAAAAYCTSLTDSNYPGSCPGGAAVIDPWFTGWYLRVANRLRGPHTPVAPIAETSPYGHPAWPANAITSATIVGRIAPADGPRQATCGPPPLPTPTSSTPPTRPPLPGATHFTARISRHGAVRVQCAARCEVLLVAKRGRHVVRQRRVLSGPKTITLRLSARSLKRLSAKRATLTLYINGVALATRTVLLRKKHHRG